MNSSIEKRLERLETAETSTIPWERLVIDGTQAEQTEQLEGIETQTDERNVSVRVIVPATDQTVDEVQTGKRSVPCIGCSDHAPSADTPPN